MSHEKVDPDKWYTVESDEFPIKGISSESEEEAERRMNEKVSRVMRAIEKGNQIDDLCFAEIEKVEYGDFLQVEIGLNAGDENDYKCSPIKLIPLGNNFFTQYYINDGFVCWSDIVADNYYIRFHLRAFLDDDINTGNSSSFQYKLKLFQTLSYFWD